MRKEAKTVILPSLGGVVPMYLCFFFIYFCSNFVPNLLRKAVKLEGTQEGIVGTKHSREQLDVSYKKKKKKSLHSFIPHFYPYHQCADR